MTNFKEYFRFHLKSNTKSVICILAVVLVLTFIIGINSQPIRRYSFINGDTVQDYRSTLDLPVTFMCILAYILPVTEFSFFKKRINLDCAYSLPISRRTMGAVHYLTGLTVLFGGYTASYLLNFILLLSHGTGWFYFSPMIVHYFLCLVLGFVLYSVMVFVFNEANTKGDGIWFMILYTYIVLVLCFALTVLSPQLAKLLYNNEVLYTVPWLVMVDITDYFQEIVQMDKCGDIFNWMSLQNLIWIIFWIAAGIASAIGFFFTFGKRRMEKTEEISDSYLGFRVLIPIYAICGMICLGDVSIIFSVIIELITLLGYTIYRRGFHYKKSDIVVLCVLLLFLFV